MPGVVSQYDMMFTSKMLLWKLETLQKRALQCLWRTRDQYIRIYYRTVLFCNLVIEVYKSVTKSNHVYALQWCHNEHDRISNNQPHDCLLNHLFRRRSKKTSASLTFVQGIHRWLVNSPHNEPVTWKMFPSDDVIMINEIFNIKRCTNGMFDNFLLSKDQG